MDNKIVSIPNSAVVAAEIVNFTATGTRRLDINLEVSYGVSAEQVLQIMNEAANQDTVLADPAPNAVVMEYKQSSINYCLMVWCKAEDYWGTKFAINQKLSCLAKEAGICLYDPHLHVHVEK